MKASRCYLHLVVATWAALPAQGFFETDQFRPPFESRNAPDATCRMSLTEKCTLSEMQRDKVYLVYPGGKTRCLSADEPEYSFIVIPGDRDKLLVYFEGGGICFDETSLKFRMCPDHLGDTRVDGFPMGHGIFSRTSDKNPFKNYTIVALKYCSGDFYLGNAKKSYGEVRGLTNAWTTINWAREMGNPWDKLILTGISAGGIALNVWSRVLLQQFRYNSAAVLIDSFVVGIFPIAAQRMLTEHFDLCNTGLLSPEHEAACNAGELAVQNTLALAMDDNPDVAFAMVNSKTDSGQTWMYNLVSTMLFKAPVLLTPEDYYRQVLSQLELYNIRPNFVSYLINADVHGYFNKEIEGSATTSGLYGYGWPGETPLHEWLKNFPVKSGAEVKSQCFGNLLYPGQWLTNGPTSDYCDQYQAQKVYGQVEVDMATAHSLSKDFDFGNPERRPADASKHDWQQFATHMHESKDVPHIGNILARSEPDELSQATLLNKEMGMLGYVLPIGLVASLACCCAVLYLGRSYLHRASGRLALLRARSTSFGTESDFSDAEMLSE